MHIKQKLETQAIQLKQRIQCLTLYDLPQPLTTTKIENVWTQAKHLNQRSQCLTFQWPLTSSNLLQIENVENLK